MSDQQTPPIKTIGLLKFFGYLLAFVFALLIALTISIVLIFGPGFGAGTHGSIKGYSYKVNKAQLETAVNNVIDNEPNISRTVGVVPAYAYEVDTTNGRQDTLFNDPKNDRHQYLSIGIESKGRRYRYTFHFYGDAEYWATSDSSEISIAYAYDGKGRGGSAGNGDVTWYTPFLKKDLTTVFETGFVNKLDKALGQKHHEEE